MLLPKNKFSMISFQFLDQAMGVEIMESERASKREREQASSLSTFETRCCIPALQINA